VKADNSGAATIALNMSPDAMDTLIFHYNLRVFDTDKVEVRATCNPKENELLQ